MDYNALLNLKNNKNIILFVLLILLFISFIKILNIEVYDNYNCKGIYHEEIIYLNIPIDNSDTLLNGEYLKINNKKYEYKIVSIGSLQVDEASLINYQEIAIKVEEKFLEKEVLDITIYYNYEKITQKLKEVLL